MHYDLVQNSCTVSFDLGNSAVLVVGQNLQLMTRKSRLVATPDFVIALAYQMSKM